MGQGVQNKAEAETCRPYPHEIGDQEGLSEETGGQEDIREAETITSQPLLDRSAE